MKDEEQKKEKRRAERGHDRHERHERHEKHDRPYGEERKRKSRPAPEEQFDAGEMLF